MKLYMDACHFGNILPPADKRNKPWHRLLESLLELGEEIQ